MKTRRYLLLAGLCMFVLNNTVPASAKILRADIILSIQEPPQPPSALDMSRRETEWMKKDLSLTPAQLPTVDSLNYAFAQKIADAMQNNSGDRDSKRSVMMDIQQQKRKALEKVLTAEQLKQYDVSFQEHREKRGNRPPRE